MSLPPIDVTQGDVTLTLTRFSTSVRIEAIAQASTQVSDVVLPEEYAFSGAGVTGVIDQAAGITFIVGANLVTLLNNAPTQYIGGFTYDAAYLDVGGDDGGPALPVDAPNRGAAPVDLTSDVGKVRLLVGDTDPRDPAGGFGTFMWYSDDELGALLAVNGGKPRLVAAGVLRAVAVTQAMRLKRWSSADLSVNGPAVAEALFKAADALVDEQRAEDQADAGDFFLMAPVGGRDPFAAQARAIDGIHDPLTFSAMRVTEILGDAVPTGSA